MILEWGKKKGRRRLVPKRKVVRYSSAAQAGELDKAERNLLHAALGRTSVAIIPIHQFSCSLLLRFSVAAAQHPNSSGNQPSTRSSFTTSLVSRQWLLASLPHQSETWPLKSPSSSKNALKPFVWPKQYAQPLQHPCCLYLATQPMAEIHS